MALTLHGTVSDNEVALDRKTATPLIINGDMQIAQRGTSETGITTGGYYTLDRFEFSIGTAGTWTMSQDTDVPTGQGFSSSLKLDCTTANASLSASSVNRIRYKMEGQDLQLLKKGTSNAESVTLSFWVKSAKTGTYVVELVDGDNTRHISKSYTINSANTWEKKIINYDGDTTGTLNNDNGQSLTLFFWLGAGTDFTSGTLATSWASITNANKAVGNVNLADSTSNDWYITGVQLEVGTFDANSISPFQFEDRATSLARCQRYYIRENKIQASQTISINYISSSTTSYGGYYFNTEMRAQPTLSYSALGDFWLTSGANIVPSLIDAFRPSHKNAGIRVQVSSGLTSAESGWFRFDNDSPSSPPQYLDFDSEL